MDAMDSSKVKPYLNALKEGRRGRARARAYQTASSISSPLPSVACLSLSLSWGVHRLEPLLEPLALARAEALAGGGVLARFSCSCWFCLRSASAEARASSALRRTSETGVPRGERAGVCGVGGAATACIRRGTARGTCSTAEPAAARSALFSRACTVKGSAMGDFGQASEQPPRPLLGWRGISSWARGAALIKCKWRSPRVGASAAASQGTCAVSSRHLGVALLHGEEARRELLVLHAHRL